jgi:hypothetical protein
VVDVVEHEAEVARFIDSARHRLLRLNQPEPGWKLARAETRLMETLPPAGAAIECVESKLVQRWDEDLRRFLQLADELAWSCYQPALEASKSGRRKPPLVFLNGGLSPFALSRDRAFRAEDVPGQPALRTHTQCARVKGGK